MVQPLIDANAHRPLESHVTSAAATAAHASLDGQGPTLAIPIKQSGASQSEAAPASQDYANSSPSQEAHSVGSSTNVPLMGQLPTLYSAASWGGPQRTRGAPQGTRAFRKSATLMPERSYPERRVLNSPFEVGSSATHGGRREWDETLLKRKLVCYPSAEASSASKSSSGCIFLIPLWHTAGFGEYEGRSGEYDCRSCL
jgi:hypothetical protein